ncbi:MAG TPA: DUF1631 domain-containing protein [Usitatibacter sp.]|nr:DUF1631 domain-containing protein [Usitatibacter sp.]
MGPSNGNVVPLDPARARLRLTPQESASVLSGCRDLALERMTRALSGMLDRVEGELETLAEKSSDREAQAVYRDARSRAREKRSAIESTFRGHFAEFFNRKVRGESPISRTQAGAELALVDHEDLEETLAVSEMSRKLKAACEGELFALGQRMGYLLERPELDEDANPMSPATICAALKDACDEIESGFKVRMALLRQLEVHAEALLQTVYKDLNAHLVERRILPDVRPVARRSPSSPQQPRKEAPAAEPPKAAAPDLFGALTQLLAGTSPGGPTATAAPWPNAPGAQPSAPAPLVAELTRMHRDGTATAPAEALVNVVRGLKLSAQSEHLGAVDAMTIDIVAMLFDYVFEDRHIPDSVKAILGRLQIPILKVALMDKSFFSSKAHPARRLIDVLAEVSIGLDAGNERGGQTLTLVQEVAERVLNEFDTDLGLFESLVARVEAFIAEGRLTEDDVIARSAKLIESRERMEIARVLGEEEIERRMAGRAWIPTAVREMLRETWSAALANAQLAGGEGSPAWQSLVQTMEDLLWSVEPKGSAEDRKRLVTMLPGMLRALQGGFARAGAPLEQREAFFSTLVDCHSHAVKAGLRGIAALPEVPVPPSRVEPVIERELVPAGDIQVEEIRLKAPRGAPARNVFTRTGIWTNLQRGTWVEFRREAGEAMRARLTWISPNKGVYLFTNPVSAAVALSISPEALAEQLRRGEARMLDDAPLVDRAVDSIFATLRSKDAAA